MPSVCLRVQNALVNQGFDQYNTEFPDAAPTPDDIAAWMWELMWNVQGQEHCPDKPANAEQMKYWLESVIKYPEVASALWGLDRSECDSAYIGAHLADSWLAALTRCHPE